ncbi:hypothetical protein ACP70R_000988 [Stipagrostis hirtigluma subsp. patula]
MGEAPRPRSPPRYPDLCGRRRLQLEVHILNRELGFLQQEIQGLERIQPVSRCCKDVNEFVSAKTDPLIPINKRKHGSCSLYWWIRIETVHLLVMPVLLVPLLAEAQEAKLLQLFLLLLRRHDVLQAKLQLPTDPFVLRTTLQLLRPRPLRLQPSQLRLRPLRRRRRRVPQLLPPVQQLLVLLLRGVRRLPRRRRAVPELPAAVLQVPVVVLRGGAFLHRQGSVLPRVVLPR